jgi:alkylation response protein AidB-like acyl-CoA dehydrogenase
MNFAMTAEQELMRDSVRRLVDREVTPRLDAAPPDASLPRADLRAMMKAFADVGLTAARLPAPAGGPGITMLDYGIMFEQIPPFVALALMAHEGSSARLHADGTDEQRARLLPDFVAGNRVFCTASTEPDTGSDPRGVRTRLFDRGGQLVLQGRKQWISNVAECDAVLVTCLDCRDGRPGTQVVKVVVERDRSPFEARNIDMMGFRQGWLGEAVFEGCVVSPENVVENQRGGTEVLKASWGVNRPLFSLLAVHLAERARDAALDYARTRRQFGKPIAAHQLVQKNLSDIDTAIVASRLLCYHALSMFDQGRGNEGIAAMAKRYTQNACRDAIWQAMNLFGAMGLSVEAKMERMYRDVHMIAVGDGTNEILSLIHGREITGMEAFRGIPAKPNH